MAGEEQQLTHEVPSFVVTDEDRERWTAAEGMARMALGDDAPEDAVWQLRRTIFHDRDAYPS